MGYSLKNVDVRLDIRKSGYRQYDVAKQMNISESFLSRLLRDDLTEENRDRIYNAISALRNGQ